MFFHLPLTFSSGLLTWPAVSNQNAQRVHALTIINVPCRYYVALIWAHQMWHGSHANEQQMKEYAASQECLIQPLLLFYFNTPLNYTDLLAHTRAGQSDHFVSRLSLKTSTINTFQVNFWSWPFVSYKCVLFMFSIYSICVAFSCQDLPKLLTC